MELRKAGFDGFLIGESFMKTEEPEKACEVFIEEIKF
jgi:indole-3-glycerol phosphate synthase